MRGKVKKETMGNTISMIGYKEIMYFYEGQTTPSLLNSSCGYD